MGILISDKFTAWQAECEAHFQQLKKNEEIRREGQANSYPLLRLGF